MAEASQQQDTYIPLDERSFLVRFASRSLSYGTLGIVIVLLSYVALTWPDVFGTYYPTALRYIGVAASLIALMYGLFRLLVFLGVKREAATGYALILPWLIGFLGFNVFPIGLSFYLSFTEYNILWDAPEELEDPLFNFKKALSIKVIELEEGERLSVSKLGQMESPVPPSERVVRYRELDTFTIFGQRYALIATDPYLWKALWLTFRYAFFNIPLGLLGALGTALLLNQGIKGVGFWRTLYYLPAVLPAAATALLWYWIFAPNSGLINWLFDPLYNLLDWERPGWFSDPNLVLPSFVIMGMWGIFGANTVILLAGLKNIPPALYEAASIDGAGTLRKFRYVTLPMLSPTMFYVLVTNTIAALQVFTLQAFIPTDRTDGWFVNWLIYNEAFNFGRMGYASALGWMVAVMIILFTLFIFRTSAAWVFYEGARQREGGA
ncbi:MAG: sugar ABC transporter permease [Chloroflexi bacterium]|nr:sugar ABC transporter permease [Chloroflexota bacterium]